MQRKVRIIRLWLLLGASLLLGLYDPLLWFGIAPAAFLAHPCSPCCTFCAPCSGPVSESYQLELSGVVDDDCTDCTQLNTTFVLDTFTSTCRLANEFSHSFTCSGPASGSTITVVVNFFGTNPSTAQIIIDVFLTSDIGQLHIARWSEAKPTAVDCTAFDEEPFGWEGLSLGCDGSAEDALLTSL